VAFLIRLAQNEPTFSPCFGATPHSIEASYNWIGISLPKYIVTRSPDLLGCTPEISLSLGRPEGLPWLHEPPIPIRLATLFLNYYLSEEAMTLFARRPGDYVLALGVWPPISDCSPPSKWRRRLRKQQRLLYRFSGGWTLRHGSEPDTYGIFNGA